MELEDKWLGRKEKRKDSLWTTGKGETGEWART